MTSYTVSPLSWTVGIIWPVECIPYPLRYISMALPQTYASEALRCIMYRGNVCVTLISFIMLQAAVARLVCSQSVLGSDACIRLRLLHSQSSKSLISSGSCVRQLPGM